jgi:hypothetical protein
VACSALPPRATSILRGGRLRQDFHRPSDVVHKEEDIPPINGCTGQTTEVHFSIE